MSKSKLVFIVDDDTDFGSVLAEVVSSMGLKPQTFDNVDDAISLLSTLKPDFIVTDYVFPVDSGFKLIHAAKKLNNKTPIFFMTGYETIEGQKELENYQPLLLVKKPFQIEILCRFLDSEP